ncbi:MAG TPA: acylphosphatase [Candidatus Acidoferrales bacterium]|nr:acylphosphatase [Candidatus Acidoferrales bacterium]
MQEENTSKRYYVSGTVQGVGYRYFVERVGRHLQLGGYVRNLSDGRVEVYAIGPASSLAVLREELERGPSAADVATVIEEEVAIDPGCAGEFSIEYDG